MNKTNFIREKKRNENKAEWKKNKEIYEQYKGKKTGRKITFEDTQMSQYRTTIQLLP